MPLSVFQRPRILLAFIPQVVREGVQSLKEAMYTQQQEWLEHGKRLKNHHANVERQKAEREALLTLKKKLSLQVRNEVEQLTKDSRLQKSNLLDSNRSSAGKIRMETADQVRVATSRKEGSRHRLTRRRCFCFAGHGQCKEVHVRTA